MKRTSRGRHAAGIIALTLVACGDDARSDPDADVAIEVDAVFDIEAADVADTPLGDVVPPECEADDACVAVLGAPGVCRAAACVGGQCVLRLSDEGTPCDDGDPCTVADQCSAGACSGSAADCDDDEPCTFDFCAQGAGCTHLAAGGECDDEDACTTGDFCQSGACTGLDVPGCDGDVCADAACTGSETCASCPADCSPIGAGECAGACDPTAVPTTCAANFACVPADGAPTGACLGQTVACDAGAQIGCAAHESCLPLAGVGVSGVAYLCAAARGERIAGEACGNQRDCGAKLVCASGVCRVPCDPASATCDGGVCNDLAALFSLPAGALGACGPGCGDGVCAPAEGCETCAADCGDCDLCGDVFCGATESCTSCALDCGLCAECGNGVCQDGETCLDCAADCGACALCGDDVCAAGEDCVSCPGDCATCAGTCGDATCSVLENCTSCDTLDCGACPILSCGDGQCGPAFEDCASCPADCGACATTCGDHTCEPGETCASCSQDCAFIAGLACRGACDPTAAITGCADNHACVPTSRGQAFPAAFDRGSGVCGAHCDSDSDCGGGACLRLAGLDVAGLCGARCAPGVTGCADGATCMPYPAAPDEGVCVAGGACNPFGDPCATGSSCVPVDGAAEIGVCVIGCHVRAPGCASGECHAKTAAAWHEGSCIGQDTACDVARQTGCAATETCIVVSGPAIGGVAHVCR